MSLLAVAPRTGVSPAEQSHEIGAVIGPLAATVRRHQATLNGAPGTKLDAEWLRTVMADTTSAASSLQEIGARITSIDDPSLQCDFRILRRDLACLQNRVKCYVSRSKKKEPESVTTPPPPITPKIGLSPKRALTVSKLPCNYETYVKVAATARQWQQIIGEKLAGVPKPHPEIFCNLLEVAKSIQTFIGRAYDGLYGGSIYVCEDVALKEIQTIAFVHNDIFRSALNIDFIATHPRNVRSSLNETETTRVEGAGSALIQHLATELRDSGMGITLESYPSAIPFYEKLGFALKTGSDNSMCLSAQKIQLMTRKAA